MNAMSDPIDARGRVQLFEGFVNIPDDIPDSVVTCVAAYLISGKVAIIRSYFDDIELEPEKMVAPSPYSVVSGKVVFNNSRGIFLPNLQENVVIRNVGVHYTEIPYSFENVITDNEISGNSVRGILDSRERAEEDTPIIELKEMPLEDAMELILEYVRANPNSRTSDILCDLGIDIEIGLKALEQLKENELIHSEELHVNIES